MQASIPDHFCYNLTLRSFSASPASAHVQEAEGPGRAEKRSELASACCALAEKLMEGAPDVAAVQDAVEDALAQARRADDHSPEPLQVQAG